MRMRRTLSHNFARPIGIPCRNDNAPVRRGEVPLTGDWLFVRVIFAHERILVRTSVFDSLRGREYLAICLTSCCGKLAAVGPGP